MADVLDGGLHALPGFSYRVIGQPDHEVTGARADIDFHGYRCGVNAMYSATKYLDQHGLEITGEHVSRGSNAISQTSKDTND
jgi:hypothetical protein